MKTRCPGCQTTFRVTPEQLKARVGKVRCGQCQTVFNALDSLVEANFSTTPPVAKPVQQATPRQEPLEISFTPSSAPAPSAAVFEVIEFDHVSTDAPRGDIAAEAHDFPPDTEIPQDEAVEEALEEAVEEAAEEETHLLSETAAQELGKATGLIMPRETTEIPGYSKWAEGVMYAQVPTSTGRTPRWPFVLAAVLLVLALAGQVIFRFRSEIAITAPSLRPTLEVFSQAFNADLPLPRHVELVSIEASDLQNDPTRGNLLVLNATLRNRAAYEQAYPSLELSLTDTADAAIARRVFPPAEYLSAKIPADQPFKANSDVAVRLWIEARDVSAAGYRLYVFYP